MVVVNHILFALLAFVTHPAARMAQASSLLRWISAVDVKVVAGSATPQNVLQSSRVSSRDRSFQPSNCTRTKRGLYDTGAPLVLLLCVDVSHVTWNTFLSPIYFSLYHVDLGRDVVHISMDSRFPLHPRFRSDDAHTHVRPSDVAPQDLKNAGSA